MKNNEAMEVVKESMKVVKSSIEDLTRKSPRNTDSINLYLALISKELDKILKLKDKAGCSERELYNFSLNLADVSGWINSAKEVRYMNVSWSEVLPVYEEVKTKFEKIRGEQAPEREQ